MSNVVLLNNVDHADLRVAAGHAARFGDAVNQTLILPTEWEEVQREYPILFRRGADGAFLSVALLGLDRDENLFLREDRWDGRYVPALHQRGPFSIGLLRDRPDAEPMIHVDLDHPRIAAATDDAAADARPVFLPHGGNTAYLDAVADVLRRIHLGTDIVAPLFRALDGAGLIRPVSLDVELDETRRYRLDGFHTIAAERLAALDGNTLADLHARGFLQPAFWALSSLANVSRLIERKRAVLA